MFTRELLERFAGEELVVKEIDLALIVENKKQLTDEDRDRILRANKKAKEKLEYEKLNDLKKDLMIKGTRFTIEGRDIIDNADGSVFFSDVSRDAAEFMIDIMYDLSDCKGIYF